MTPRFDASLAMLLLLAMLGGGCESSTGASGRTAPDKLVVTGSSTVAPLASEIARRYEKLHPNVRIDVQTGGSSRGVADARKGLADIGMVSRALYEEEQDLHSFTIAQDGVCLIVHSSNPIETLSTKQVVAVYSGKITNWKDLGGDDGPIVVVNKAEGRSTLELFLHHFHLKNSDVKAEIVIGDNQQGIKTVTGNPQAIGYVSIGAAQYEAEQGAPLRLLPLEGSAATIDNVRSGQFPLSRPLNLVTLKEPIGLAKSFIDFAQSDEVQDLRAAQYFVAP